MNSRTIIQKCSEQLGYSYEMIEEVFMSYWKDKKEYLQKPTHQEIMLDYIGKFELTDKRVKTSVKYQEKQLMILDKKIENSKIEKGVKLTNIRQDIVNKIELLNHLKQKYNF